MQEAFYHSQGTCPHQCSPFSLERSQKQAVYRHIVRRNMYSDIVVSVIHSRASD